MVSENNIDKKAIYKTIKYLSHNEENDSISIVEVLTKFDTIEEFNHFVNTHLVKGHHSDIITDPVIHAFLNLEEMAYRFDD